MIAVTILLYSVKLYKSGDTGLEAAERAEKIGTWLGVIAILGLVIFGSIYGYNSCILDSSAAQLDALSALGCNGVAANEMGVTEICVQTALTGVDQVAQAAAFKSWSLTVMLGLLIL